MLIYMYIGTESTFKSLMNTNNNQQVLDAEDTADVLDTCGRGWGIRHASIGLVALLHNSIWYGNKRNCNNLFSNPLKITV